jgi:hypothetical protein
MSTSVSSSDSVSDSGSGTDAAAAAADAASDALRSLNNRKIWGGATPLPVSVSDESEDEADAAILSSAKNPDDAGPTNASNEPGIDEDEFRSISTVRAKSARGLEIEFSQTSYTPSDSNASSVFPRRRK